MRSDFELGERLIAAARDILSSRLRAETGIAYRRKNGDHRDLVTECDLAVERMMRDELARERPADLVLAEEGAAPEIPQDARVWIIDPIDGTTNFLRWGHSYAISVALWESKRPVFGLLYDAASSRLYSAVPGDGVRADGSPLPLPSGPEPKEGDPLNSMLLDASLNTIAALIARGADVGGLSRRLRGHRSLGCASLAILHVASGELDAFVSDRLRPWDWAAADVMLSESGGVCTGLFGRELDPYDPSPVPFLAARSTETAAALIQALSGKRYECAQSARS